MLLLLVALSPAVFVASCCEVLISSRRSLSRFSLLFCAVARVSTSLVSLVSDVTSGVCTLHCTFWGLCPHDESSVFIISHSMSLEGGPFSFSVPLLFVVVSLSVSLLRHVFFSHRNFSSLLFRFSSSPCSQLSFSSSPSAVSLFSAFQGNRRTTYVFFIKRSFLELRHSRSVV